MNTVIYRFNISVKNKCNSNTRNLILFMERFSIRGYWTEEFPDHGITEPVGTLHSFSCDKNL